MEAGIDDVGCGVLFGLEAYRYDFVGILMHAEHLEARFGVGPHTISVPKIVSADDIDTKDFTNAVPDEIFQKIVAVIRIAVPYTGMIISTRESQKCREKVLDLGIPRSAEAPEPLWEAMQRKRQRKTTHHSLMSTTDVLWMRS